MVVGCIGSWWYCFFSSLLHLQAEIMFGKYWRNATSCGVTPHQAMIVYDQIESAKIYNMNKMINEINGSGCNQNILFVVVFMFILRIF